MQGSIAIWLRWLRLDIGFDAWRFDFVKGSLVARRRWQKLPAALQSSRDTAFGSKAMVPSMLATTAAELQMDDASQSCLGVAVRQEE